MKFFPSLVVVALLCSFSESRFVSRCELRSALNNTISLPAKLKAFKQKILAIVACEVERKSNFDTNLVNVEGFRPTTARPVDPTTGGSDVPVGTAPPIETSTNSGSESTNNAPVRKKRHAQGKSHYKSNSTAIPLGWEEMIRNNSHMEANENHVGGKSQEKQQGKRRGRRSASWEATMSDKSNSTAIPFIEAIMRNYSQVESNEDHTGGKSQEKQKGKRRGKRSASDENETSEESEESDESKESDESIESNEFESNSTESLFEMLNGHDNMLSENGMILDNSYLKDNEDQTEENHKGKKRNRRPKSKNSEESNESNESMPEKKMTSLGFYGIFQLSDSFACDSGYQWSRNMCQTSCSAFTDDDITDDVACFVETGYWREMLSMPSRQCYQAADTYFAGCGLAA